MKTKITTYRRLAGSAHANTTRCSADAEELIANDDNNYNMYATTPTWGY